MMKQLNSPDLSQGDVKLKLNQFVVDIPWTSKGA